MGANTIAIVPGKISTAPGVTFTNADGTATKAVVTAGTNGTRVDSLAGVSDDTVDRVFTLYLYDGSADKRLGEAIILLGAGTSGVRTKPAINILDRSLLPWLDNTGSIFLPAGYSLRAACQTTVTSGKTVTITPFGGDY